MDDAHIVASLYGRGGSIQRTAFDADLDDGDSSMAGSESSENEKCDLVEALLFLFGWGLLSMPLICWISRCAIKAGAHHPDLLVLANVGSAGL